MVSLRAHLGRSLTGPHRLLRLTPALALAAWAFAQPAPAADTNAMLTAWFAAQTNLQTWSASFIQTRSLKTLVQPLTSTGRVSVASPDRFRWELGDPPQTIASTSPLWIRRIPSPMQWAAVAHAETAE